MGIFDRIISSSKGYPRLDEASPAADRVAKISDQLESLSKQVHQPLEVVPGEEGAFVFIGKPPRDFGIAWIAGNKLHSFKTLAEEQGVMPEEIKKLSDRLRKVYEENQEDERFSMKVGRKSIVVTPSKQFSQQVNEVIQQAAH